MRVARLRETLRDQFFRKGFFTLIIKIGEGVSTLIIAFLLARLLGASGYGTYSFVLALVSLIAVPTRIGLPPLIVRETALGQARTDWAHVAGIWRWSLVISVALSVAVAGIASLCLHFDASENDISATFAWGVLLVPVLSLAAIRMACLRGLGHVLAGILPEQTLRPALLISLLLLWSWANPTQLTPSLAMLFTLAAGVGSLLAGVWLLRKHRPQGLMDAHPVYRARDWLTAAIPLALTQSFHQINRNVDLLILGMLSSSSEVGVYRVAMQGSLVVSIGLTALNSVAAPQIARLYATGQIENLEKIALTTSRCAALIALPIVFLLAVFGKTLLIEVFGRDFAEAYLPLLILSVAQLAAAANGVSVLLLNMTAHEADATRTLLVCTTVNFALNFALIPLFGATGAAISAATSLIGWHIWLRRRVRVRLKIGSSLL